MKKQCYFLLFFYVSEGEREFINCQMFHCMLILCPRQGPNYKIAGIFLSQTLSGAPTCKYWTSTPPPLTLGDFTGLLQQFPEFHKIFLPSIINNSGERGLR